MLFNQRSEKRTRSTMNLQEGISSFDTKRAIFGANHFGAGNGGISNRGWIIWSQYQHGHLRWPGYKLQMTPGHVFVGNMDIAIAMPAKNLAFSHLQLELSVFYLNVPARAFHIFRRKPLVHQHPFIAGKQVIPQLGFVFAKGGASSGLPSCNSGVDWGTGGADFRAAAGTEFIR
jgi:hypothetical protein